MRSLPPRGAFSGYGRPGATDMSTSAARLELAGITKYYGQVLGVGPVSLTVEPGEFVSLLGPSGCGKTTTLRIVAGLETPSSGELLINGEAVTHAPVHRRNIGLVFQNYALFPHLSIHDNIAFGLRYRKVDKTEIADRVEQVLKLVNLHGLGKRLPRQLSGGQQQRVAVARAIVINPSILLFDEPLINLDMALRQHMQEEIKRIQREVGITTLYVTHDQNEAMALSDRIAVLFHGHLHQLAPPSDIYEQPATAEVADFIGEINYLGGEVRETAGGAVFRTAQGTTLQLAADCAARAGDGRRIAIRPHRVRVVDGDSGAANVFVCEIERSVYSGDLIRARLRLPAGDVLQVNAHNVQELRKHLLGPKVAIELRPQDLQFFPDKVTTAAAPAVATGRQ